MKNTNELKILELKKADYLIVKCIRSWVKSVVFKQNPIPQLINYLISYGRGETVIPFDDFMTSIFLSSVKFMILENMTAFMLVKPKRKF